MYSNWVSDLDMLASSGVINFDAPAYLLDQPARYVGNPNFESLPMTNPSLLPEGTKMKDQPKSDGFNNADKNLIQNPSWKKWTFGAIAAAAVAGGIYAVSKGKIKIPNFKNFSMAKAGTAIKNFGTKAIDYIKKPFIWIANKCKK